jgi:hypothetical protein
MVLVAASYDRDELCVLAQQKRGKGQRATSPVWTLTSFMRKKSS